MNDKTVSVLKNIIKKWVREYNILDGCLELEKNKIAELKAENERLKEKITNIERITREGFADYYYTYTKDNPFFLNIIKEIEK